MKPVFTIITFCLAMSLAAQNQADYLIPRMDSEQRTKMHQPPNGLLIFDTDTGSYWYFQAGYWIDLKNGSSESPQAHPFRSMTAATPNSVKIEIDGKEKVKVDSIHMSVMFPDSSTMIGFEAGLNNAEISAPVVDDQGKYNTFIGLQAGRNTNPNPNSCSDYEYFDIYENGCGSNNTFLGNKSGFTNVLGRNNVFVGSRAGFSNFGDNSFYSAGEGGSGSENTFVGFLSGHFNQNGFWNTFLGAYAGERNGVGSMSDFIGRRNTYVGASAGRHNEDGVENVYLGTEAGGGFENLTGSRNVYTGYQSGRKNQGNDNVYVGHYTGLGDPVFPRHRNVLLGALAGQFMSGNNNVFIGYGAGQTTSGDNKLIIGNSPSSELIYGEFNTPRVRINGQLHVNSTQEATLAQTGAFLIGNEGGNNLNMDPNEIQARNGQIQTTLFIQPNAGQLRIGNSNDNTTDKVLIETEAGVSALRVRQNLSTKLMVHSNGGVSAGTFSTPPTNGLSVGGNVQIYGTRIDKSGDLTMEATGTLTIKAGLHTITILPTGDITIDSDNNVNITSDLDINLTAGDDILLNASDDIILDAGSDIIGLADARMDLTGTTEMEINSSAIMDINSTGTLDLDGNGLVLLTAGSRLDLVGGTELELNSNSIIDMNSGSSTTIDGSQITLNGSGGGAAPAARAGSVVTNPACSFGCVGTVSTGSTSVLIGN